MTKIISGRPGQAIIEASCKKPYKSNEEPQDLGIHLLRPGAIVE